MNHDELREHLRVLWTTSNEPLTNARVANATGWPKSDVESAMRQLLRSGTVDVGVSDDGEVCWVLPGVSRAATPLARAAVKREAKQGVVSQNVSIPGTGMQVSVWKDPDKKSVLLSAGMGLLFGPFGWGYAGPWLEVIAGVAVYVVLGLIMPRFLLGTLFGVVHPICGVLAMLYAFRFNQTLKRTPLLFVPRDSKQ